MNQLNQIVIEGNLCRKPETKTTATGRTVSTFPIATNRYIRKSNGEFAQEVYFFDCEVWGKEAETVAKKASKGIGCRIVGRLKQERWKGRDGKAYSKVAIVSEHIDFLKSEKKDKEKAADDPENESVLEEKSKPSFDRAKIFQSHEEEPLPKASGFDIF